LKIKILNVVYLLIKKLSLEYSKHIKHIMSIIPKNITVQSEENTIDVEYNDCHWRYTGGIVPLIKNNDKIICKFDDATKTVVLNYDDGIEKFSICLSKKISLDTAETIITKSSLGLDDIKEKIKEINCKKAEKEKIINDHQQKINHQQRTISVHKKVITEHNDKINELNKEITELNDSNNFYLILIKHEYGVQLENSEMFKLLLKGIITSEYFMANTTASNFTNLICSDYDQLKKLITDKKININARTKDDKTLLEITLRNYEKFAIFLLENNIDISLSVKNDVKISSSGSMNQAYFDNAKRNNHLDLLATHFTDIEGACLLRLVGIYMESKNKLY
jgi:hypothetical protein